MSEKRLTVYKNDMNTVPFRQFTSIEMNLFFTICTQMRDQKDKTVRFNFADLRELSNYQNKNYARFVADLDRTYGKMLGLNIRRDLPTGFERFVLFTQFEINEDEEFVEITTHDKFKYIINEITENFTKFELEEFTSLRSNYAKSAFRMLKQFRQTGYWRIRVEDFRTLMDIPESYRQTAIDARVLKPITEELSYFFTNLEVKKITAKKGRKIEFFEFHFRPEDDFKPDGTKTFRAEDGEYYEQSFDRMTPDEAKKVFPEPNIKEEKLAYGTKENVYLSIGEHLALKQKGMISKIELMGDWKAKNGWKKGRQFAGGDYQKLLKWDALK